MTSVSQPMTQQGRTATPAKVCFSYQCLPLPAGLTCCCPSDNSSSISSLGFATIPLSLVTYFWWCSREGRDAPSNFSLAHSNLLSWGSFWCMTCRPSQRGLLQHRCLHVEPSPQSRLWSFVPFSCHLCTLLIFTVGWGELILSMLSGCSLPVSVSLLKFIQKQLHWGFSWGVKAFYRSQPFPTCDRSAVLELLLNKACSLLKSVSPGGSHLYLKMVQLTATHSKGTWDSFSPAVIWLLRDGCSLWLEFFSLCNAGYP